MGVSSIVLFQPVCADHLECCLGVSVPEAPQTLSDCQTLTNRAVTQLGQLPMLVMAWKPCTPEECFDDSQRNPEPGLCSDPDARDPPSPGRRGQETVPADG